MNAINYFCNKLHLKYLTVHQIRLRVLILFFLQEDFLAGTSIQEKILITVKIQNYQERPEKQLSYTMAFSHCLFLSYCISFFLPGSKEVARRCFVKKVLLKILQKSKVNTGIGVPFLIKLRASGLQLY